MPPPFPSPRLREKGCARGRDGTMVNRRNQKCDYHSQRGHTGKLLFPAFSIRRLCDDDGPGDEEIDSFALSFSELE